MLFSHEDEDIGRFSNLQKCTFKDIINVNFDITERNKRKGKKLLILSNYNIVSLDLTEGKRNNCGNISL